MPDPWKSENIQGHNLCLSCKSSSCLEVDGEVVDVTITEDGTAKVYEEIEADTVECRNCETEFEVESNGNDEEA